MVVVAWFATNRTINHNRIDTNQSTDDGAEMKICLAGTGAMGEIHVKALAKINDVQIVSVAGRTEDGVKEFATKWNIPYASTDLKACIDRPGVDAVILTTPSRSAR